MFDIIMPNKSSPIMMMEKSLLSIQEQTYKEWKCYILDDTPEDWEHWDKYQKMLSNLKDSRFKVIRSNTDSPAQARNKGIDISDSPNVAFLDSDDIWFPNHLAILAQGLQEYDICFTEISMIQPHSQLVELNNLGIDGRIGIKLDVITIIQRYEVANFVPDEYQGYYWYGSPIWFSALGCKSKVFEDCRFNEELMIAEDTNLILDWVRHGFYPRLIPEKTVHRIGHDGQLSHTVSQERHDKDMDMWLNNNKDFLITEEILMSMPIQYRAFIEQNNNLNKERNMLLENFNFNLISEEECLEQGR